jgi:hypothetical protein
MKIRYAILPVAICFAVAAPAGADDEAANRAHVAAGAYGQCYAKSVPGDHYGDRGITRVYRVTFGEDELAALYPWFSGQIHLRCNMSRNGDMGIALVRFGPWARGHQASGDHLAFAFHFKGRELARYSTLDIAGEPDNVEMSSSHYQVIRRIVGFRWIAGNDYAFEVETVDGRLLSFDPLSGESRK